MRSCGPVPSRRVMPVLPYGDGPAPAMGRTTHGVNRDEGPYGTLLCAGEPAMGLQRTEASASTGGAAPARPHRQDDTGKAAPGRPHRQGGTGGDTGGVQGRPPRRPSSPLWRALMASTSSALSSSSREAKFATIRSGVTDLGITTLPSARFQAIVTCAVVAPWSLAIFSITGSVSSPPPWPSGDQDSVMIPLDAWYSRSSGWVK